MSAIESPLFWNPGVRHQVFKNLDAASLSLMDRTNTVFHNAALDYSAEAFPALWARILGIPAFEPFLPAIDFGQAPSLRHLGELRQSLLQALDDAGVPFCDSEESISLDFFSSLLTRLLEQGNIVLAAERGNLAAVRLLFPQSPDEVKAAAFCHAASEGRAAIVQYFAPEMDPRDHERAMGEALVYNHLAVVEALDPYLEKREREYFLAASTEIGNHDAVRFFAPKCNRISKDLALIDAAQSRSFETLDYLLRSFSHDVLFLEGALFKAVQTNNLPYVQRILPEFKRISPECFGKALGWADFYGNDEMVRYLLSSVRLSGEGVQIAIEAADENEHDIAHLFASRADSCGLS